MEVLEEGVDGNGKEPHASRTGLLEAASDVVVDSVAGVTVDDCDHNGVVIDIVDPVDGAALGKEDSVDQKMTMFNSFNHLV